MATAITTPQQTLDNLRAIRNTPGADKWSVRRTEAAIKALEAKIAGKSYNYEQELNKISNDEQKFNEWRVDSYEKSIEAAKASGAKHNQAVFSSALPQILPNFTAYFLYIFELCIRASVILGLVGAGGVGRIIETQRIFLRFDRITPIIVLILIAVIAIEQFSVWLRRKIL